MFTKTIPVISESIVYWRSLEGINSKVIEVEYGGASEFGGGGVWNVYQLHSILSMTAPCRPAFGLMIIV